MSIEKHGTPIRGQIVARGREEVLAKFALSQNKHNVTAKTHGEISRGSDGNVDLSAEMGKHPDALWLRVKAIEADNENDNGDFFSKDEIIKAYKTFEGCPVFTNHENQKVENAKGKVVLSEWDDDEGSVYCTMYIDREANPSLCRAVEEGYVTDVSMGTQVDYSICSVCQNKAYTADSYCFVPGTPVLMSDLSVKNIEDVIEGDEVIDGYGRKTNVIGTYKRDIAERVKAIVSRSIFSELLCTGNHKLLVQGKDGPEAVHANCLDKNHVLLVPVHRLHERETLFDGFNFDEKQKTQFCRLLGYYAAEGSRIYDKKGDLHGIEFTLGLDETDVLIARDIIQVIQELFGKDPEIIDRRKWGVNSSLVRFYNKDVCQFIASNVQNGAKYKVLSDAITSLPNKYIREFLDAYIDGDGHASNYGHVVLTSASISLASQVYHLLLRLGVSPSIGEYANCGGPTNRDKKCLIYRTDISNLHVRSMQSSSIKCGKAARVVKCGKRLKNIFTEDKAFSKHRVWTIDEQEYKGFVYNIETESGSYVASNTAAKNCDHVKTMKGRSVDGKKVYEENYGLKFIEISVVTDGACKDCVIQEILEPAQYMEAAESLVAAAKSIKEVKTGLYKDSGQQEIELLNAAMDNIENVLRAMLDQRRYIDLEFMNNLTEVFADLQHVTDELVDQGYGSLQGGDQQIQEQVPAMPSMPESEKEEGPTGPNPLTTGPSPTGIGRVTQPASVSRAKDNLKLSSKDNVRDRLENLKRQTQKIFEQIKEETRGDNHVSKAEKNPNTISKLAAIWQNPSVKSFSTAVAEGNYKIVIGKEEILGLKGGKKIASLKVAELDEEVRGALKENPNSTAAAILDAFRGRYAELEKTAESATSDTEKQHGETMEAQHAREKLELHPRENEPRQSITESQFGMDWHGYDHHKQGLEEPRHQVTEKQLSGLADRKDFPGYDYHTVQNDARDEIMEPQLRNTKWKGNITPADPDLSRASGVSDQNQRITEHQIDGQWRKSDESHNPDHHITEKQLRDDQDDPLARRVASISKDNAKTILASGIESFCRTAIATGATPKEMLEAVSEFHAEPNNKFAALAAAASLDHPRARELRANAHRRSAYYGAKMASKSDVIDYLLGTLSDNQLSPEVGLKVLKVLADQEDAEARIAEALKAEPKPETKSQEATSEDLLKEALSPDPKEPPAEAETENVKVVMAVKDVGVEAPKDGANIDEVFVEAAFEAARKIAAEQGVEVTENLQIDMAPDGDAEKITVHMKGVVAGLKISNPVRPPKTAACECEHEDCPEGCPDDCKCKEEKSAGSEAEVKLAARSEARRKVVEGQFGGGGGTTLPAPSPTMDPAAAPGGPSAGADTSLDQGVGALTEDEGLDAEPETEGEALPPGSTCPACGSDDVNVEHGELNCNNCGGHGQFKVNIEMDNWPGSITEKGPGEEDAGEEESFGEEGIGDMEGGPGMEVPQVGLAMTFRITPEMVKVAGNRPVGSVCPHCASTETEIDNKKSTARCKKCAGRYKVTVGVDGETKELIGRIAWYDRNVAKLARAEVMARVNVRKQAKLRAAKTAARRDALKTALKAKGWTDKFSSSNLEDQAEMVGKLAELKLIPKD